MELQKDTIWEVVSNCETLASFSKNVLKPVFLKRDVPDDIKRSALIVEKILLHAYYEYEFIEVAITEAIFTLEKAMKLRWADINENAKAPSFYKLIEWFFERSYFETNNITFIHQLRNIRNGKVHDPIRSQGGLVFIKKIYSIFDLINDLYEDPGLRILRKEEIKQLQIKINKMTSNGSMLWYNNRRYFIYGCYPIIIDNSSDSKTLVVSICPYSGIDLYPQKNYKIPTHIVFTLTDWSFDGSLFKAKELHTSRAFRLQDIPFTRKKKFTVWNKRFSRRRNIALYSYLLIEPLEAIFINEWKKFHQREIIR